MKYPIRLFGLGRSLLVGILTVSYLHSPSAARSQTVNQVALNNAPPATVTPAGDKPATDKPAADKPAAQTPAPKADTEIQRDIVVAMMHDDVNNTAMFKTVKFTVAQGVVTLMGKLKTEKQHAKFVAVVTGVTGVKAVRDQIEVK